MFLEILAAMSLVPLARRMKHFGIKYIDKEVSVEEVIVAVNEGTERPWKTAGLP